MCGRVLLSLASLIIALLAVFIALPEDQLPVLQDYHELLKDYLSVFSSCPFHSSSKRSAVPVSEDGVYNVVRVDPSDRIFSKDELAQYDGKEGSPGLYLAILGLVYDVSSGRRFYEAGAGYGFFAGKSGNLNLLVDSSEIYIQHPWMEWGIWVFEPYFPYEGNVRAYQVQE